MKFNKKEPGGNTPLVKYDGLWYYTYDRNGNRTGRGKQSMIIDETREYWQYTWDSYNRLIKAEQFNAPDNRQNVCVTYTYDALNHRIKRESTAQNTTTLYAYGRNGALTYERKIYESGVTRERSFIYLEDTLIGIKEKVTEKKQTVTENTYYTLTDHLGSVTAVYDQNSNCIWKSGYKAFGNLAGKEINSFDFEGLFTGKDKDTETGLTYHWNRWRNEEGNAWLSQDPIRDGMNWYAYCNGDPINYTDPDGRVIAHLSPMGWSHHAPQRVFGYFSLYDALSVGLAFNINGTKLSGNDFTVRMWKGNYGLCGVGGEIGLYSKNGKSLNRNELSNLGLESSSFDLIDNNSRETLISQKEEKQSFWTTGFKPLHFGKKNNLTAIFSLNFKDEKSAKNFLDNIKNSISEGEDYYWNDSFGGKDKQNIHVELSENKKSVIFRYGNMEE